MSVATNIIDFHPYIKFTSYFGTDMIIGVVRGSLTVAAASAGSYATATATFDTGFGTSCYFQGQFSTDDESTWNDFGVYQPNLTTPGRPVLQTTTARAYVTSGGILTIVGINWYDSVHSTSSAQTIDYNIVLLAKINQGKITPLALPGTTYLNSERNYPKILTSGTFTASTTANTVISYDARGYIPWVASFFEPASATAGIEGVYTVPAGAMMGLDWFKGSSSGMSADVQITPTQTTFTPLQSNASTPNGITGTQHYIIYLPND